MRTAGDKWDAGHRHWLIERRRIGPVIPLFRQAGVNLDV
jgi:hypothetical protein